MTLTNTQKLAVRFYLTREDTRGFDIEELASVGEECRKTLGDDWFTIITLEIARLKKFAPRPRSSSHFKHWYRRGAEIKRAEYDFFNSFRNEAFEL